MKTRKIHIEKNQTQTVNGECCGSSPTETQPTPSSSYTSTLQTEKQSQKRNGCCG